MNTFDKVKSVIVESLNCDEALVTPEARLVEDLGADSANMMMLIMDLEAEYDMTVEDDMLSQIKTVDDIVKYIEKRVG